MSLMKKTQNIPKAYWIISAIAIIAGVALAFLIPVPRLYKWSIGFLIFVLIEVPGILGYSYWKGGRGGSSGRPRPRRRGRR